MVYTNFILTCTGGRSFRKSLSVNGDEGRGTYELYITPRRRLFFFFFSWEFLAWHISA